MIYTELKVFFQTFSLIFAIFFNILLIYLVHKKSPKRMGTYKYFIIYFSIFAIFFTCLENLVQPYAHTCGCSFVIIMQIEGRKIDKEIAFSLISALNGFFGFTIFTIAIHFIFRFCALERRGKLRYFDEKLLPIWFSIPILVGASHSLTSYFLFRPNEQFSNYVRESVMENYNFSIDDQAFAGAFFYPPDVSGEPKFDWKVGLGFVHVFFSAILSFSIVAYCGVISFLKIRHLIMEGRSKYARKLQKQLYKALVVQACIPTFLMFIPVGIFVSGPIICLNVEFMSKIATMTYALYPAIDPLPIMFIVDEYRRAIIAMLKLEMFKHNQVSIMKEEVRSVSANPNS